MKLTNQLRDAFVRAVMGDVPYVDYKEKVQELIEDAIRDQFNKSYGTDLYNRLDQDGWFESNYFYPLDNMGTFYIKAPDAWCDLNNRAFDGCRDELRKMEELYRDQVKTRRELETKLEAVAKSCSTVKQLHEALPEFAKYIQDEAPPSKNLPAVANVVSDFVKAGWPVQRPA
jgi:hypothetical protein